MYNSRQRYSKHHRHTQTLRSPPAYHSHILHTFRFLTCSQALAAGTCHVHRSVETSDYFEVHMAVNQPRVTGDAGKLESPTVCQTRAASYRTGVSAHTESQPQTSVFSLRVYSTRTVQRLRAYTAPTPEKLRRKHYQHLLPHLSLHLRHSQPDMFSAHVTLLKRTRKPPSSRHILRFQSFTYPDAKLSKTNQRTNRACSIIGPC